MRRLLLLAALGVAALAGCGDTFVDPFLRESGKLSLTGVLQATPENEAPLLQTVRVQAVRTDAAPPTDPDDPAVDFAADLVTVDTFTGDTLRWDGRRERFADGTYGQLFSATFRPRPGGTYDMVARRDTAVTRTRLVFPSGADPVQLPAERRDSGLVETFVWPAAGIDQSSAVVDVPCGLGCGLDVPAPTTVRTLADGRVAVEVGLSAAADEARRILSLRPGQRPRLGLVAVRARLLGPEWLRADDPTFTNVRNGYGFVGTTVVEVNSYRPTREVAEAAGFTY